MLVSNRSEEERVISKISELLVTSGRSLIYARIKSGSRTVSLGTPDYTSAHVEWQFFKEF